jgi:hypothetical protein
MYRTGRFAKLLLVMLLGLVPCVSWAQGAKIVISGSEGYAQRPLTLAKGRMRVDLGPSDFGYMDSGMLNSGRGLRIDVPEQGDALVGLGMGVALGVVDKLEAGLLLLPFRLSPDFDFADIEAYGRYAFLEGRYEVAAQLTLNIPTDTEFGFGLGLPTLFEIGDSVRVDTGAELEILFFDDTQVNIDVPAAFSVVIAEIAFIGARTGLFVQDFDEWDVNLGVQGGVTLMKRFDLTASFNWPYLLTTRGDDVLNLDVFRLIFGGTLYFDIYAA